MPTVCVIGAQWGDEGKGKVLDLLSADADWVVRYHGGSNAGHTVWLGNEKFVLHLVPSGILHPHVRCVIATGVVVDPRHLLEEIDGLESRGVKVAGRLFLSDRAHLVFPYHVELDKLAELRRGENRIGTTARGIGPAYADRASRIGVRVAEMSEPDAFRRHVERNVEEKNALITGLYRAKPLDAGAIVAEYLECAKRLRPFVSDTFAMVGDAKRRGERLFFEGAQGALLDIDFGTYPFVTSSHPITGGVTVGVGIPPRDVERVIGIFKAYTTRVGAGPFPTEDPGDLGKRLRERGGEFGSTTGRPRRCGWFDLVACRYSCELNGFDAGVLTKLDVLAGLSEIPVCVAYGLPNGETTRFPGNVSVLERAVPRYEKLPGFDGDVSGIRNYRDLPVEAKRYVQYLEEHLEIPFSHVSVGPEREQTIVR
ncbi:MAG: adenylosuccinate synthase [Planctomycetes bacterium]|nr:adenylosuccinate synthase [Planctomycetota bacterium]MBI3847459.1 adenylosuccinate synthase [Planctomycetota bacterium]